VYEWKEEYGDIGPRFEALEKELFGSEFHVRTGIKFDTYVSPSFAAPFLLLTNFGSDCKISPLLRRATFASSPSSLSITLVSLAGSQPDSI
jgi:hypothetical protein